MAEASPTPSPQAPQQLSVHYSQKSKSHLLPLTDIIGLLKHRLALIHSIWRRALLLASRQGGRPDYRCLRYPVIDRDDAESATRG